MKREEPDVGPVERLEPRERALADLVRERGLVKAPELEEAARQVRPGRSLLEGLLDLVPPSRHGELRELARKAAGSGGPSLAGNSAITSPDMIQVAPKRSAATAAAEALASAPQRGALTTPEELNLVTGKPLPVPPTSTPTATPLPESQGQAVTSAKDLERALGPAPPPPPPVRKIGPYVVERELGRGGMGVVLLASDPKLKRQVALKLLQADRPQELERFRIEAEAAARLSHPGIVAIHEVGQDADGAPYLALQYVAGEPLSERLRRDGPLPPRDAASLVARVARAVSYAHSRAVLHRDLKPHNILLDAAGQPFLNDFGLAKRVDQASGLTVSGQALGTPAYMAPEQAEGRLELIDRRSDVYGLGATLYHALTGQAPFAGSTTYNVIAAVLSQPPQPPRVLRPELERDLETIVLKCLEKEPEQRYASADALADDLERWLAGQPIAARPIPGWERAYRKLVRQPATVAAIGLIAVGVLAVLAAGVVTARRAQREAEGERAAAQSARALAEAEATRAQQAQGRAAEEAERAMKAEAAAQEQRQEASCRAELEHGYGLLAQERYAEAARAFARAAEAAPGASSPLGRSARRGAEEALARHALMARIPGTDGASVTACASRAESLAMGEFAGQAGRVVLRSAEGQPGRVFELGAERPVALAFLPDALVCAAAAADGAAWHLQSWSLETGQPRWELRGEGSVGPLAAAPDGSLLAAALGDAVHVLDPAAGDSLAELRTSARGHGRDEVAYALGWEPDGQRLWSGHPDGSVVGWSRAGGQFGLEGDLVPSPGSAVQVLTVLGPGELLVGNQAGDLVRLRVAERAAATLLEGEYGRLERLLRLADDLVAVGCTNGAVLLLSASGRTLRVIDGEGGEVTGLAHLPGADQLAVAGRDGVRLYALRTGELLGLSGAEGPLAWSPGDGRLACLLREARDADRQRLAVFEPGHPEAADLVMLPRPPTSRYSVTFTPAGRLLVGVFQEQENGALSENGLVLRLREDGQLHGVPVPWAACLSVSHDGRTLAAGGWTPNQSGQEEALVRRVDLAEDRPLEPLRWHRAPVRDLAWHPDGTLASASEDGTVALWGADPRERPDWVLQVGAEQVQPGAEASPGRNAAQDRASGGVLSCDFGPDGRTLATASVDGTLRLWQVVPGSPPRLLARLTAGRSGLTWCRFLRDGRLVGASSAGTIWVWDPEARRLLRRQPLPGARSITACALTPEGERLAVSVRPDGVRFIGLEGAALPGLSTAPGATVEDALRDGLQPR